MQNIMPRIKKTIDVLKDENLELKLSDVRKDVLFLEEKMCSRLDKIDDNILELIEHVKKTNGSVARVQEQANKIEQTEKDHFEFRENIDKIDEETKTIRWLIKHPKTLGAIIILPFMFLSVKGIEGVIEVVSKIITFIW
jgi:hypothetical protein